MSMKRSKYKVYNDARIFKSAASRPNWAVKEAHSLAKAAGESYLTVMEGKKIHSLKCVLRFGKKGLKKCPSRSKKVCKRLMVVQCHPTRSFKPVGKLRVSRRKKR